MCVPHISRQRPSHSHMVMDISFVIKNPLSFKDHIHSWRNKHKTLIKTVQLWANFTSKNKPSCLQVNFHCIRWSALMRRSFTETWHANLTIINCLLFSGVLNFGTSCSQETPWSPPFLGRKKSHKNIFTWVCQTWTLVNSCVTYYFALLLTQNLTVHAITRLSYGNIASLKRQDFYSATS